MNKENPGRRFLVEEYRSRINRVIDYIEANIDRDLSLSELAEVAHFSPFHFHRIFRAMVGETLNGFIQRIRLEKAAMKLALNPRESITEIATECGFSGPSAFARAFRDTFGMSASQWRSGGHRQYSKNGKTDSKYNQSVGNIRQDFIIFPHYNLGKSYQFWRVEMKNEKIKLMAYINNFHRDIIIMNKKLTDIPCALLRTHWSECKQIASKREKEILYKIGRLYEEILCP